MCLQKKLYNLHFHREENGNWYIVLPSWPFAHANLQMVAGADDLLSELAGEKNHVHCDVRINVNKPEKEEIRLDRLKGCVTYGATYDVSGSNVKKLWLCPVTLFVFKGEYPSTIYINNVTIE